jgi:hypothetical protein
MRNAAYAFGLLFIALFSTPIYAQCTDAKYPLVSCSVGAKTLNVCFNTTSEILTYRYGPNGAPELELKRGLDKLELRTWSGVGDAIVESLEISNKGYTYRIYAGHRRKNQTNFAGVTVLRGNDRLADFNCTRGGGGAWVFDPISEALRNHGYCPNGHGYFRRDEICAW